MTVESFNDTKHSETVDNIDHEVGDKSDNGGRKIDNKGRWIEPTVVFVVVLIVTLTLAVVLARGFVPMLYSSDSNDENPQVVSDKILFDETEDLLIRIALLVTFLVFLIGLLIGVSFYIFIRLRRKQQSSNTYSLEEEPQNLNSNLIKLTRLYTKIDLSSRELNTSIDLDEPGYVTRLQDTENGFVDVSLHSLDKCCDDLTDFGDDTVGRKTNDKSSECDHDHRSLVAESSLNSELSSGDITVRTKKNLPSNLNEGWRQSARNSSYTEAVARNSVLEDKRPQTTLFSEDTFIEEKSDQRKERKNSFARLFRKKSKAKSLERQHSVDVRDKTTDSEKHNLNFSGVSSYNSFDNTDKLGNQSQTDTTVVSSIPEEEVFVHSQLNGNSNNTDDSINLPSQNSSLVSPNNVPNTYGTLSKTSLLSTEDEDGYYCDNLAYVVNDPTEADSSVSIDNCQVLEAANDSDNSAEIDEVILEAVEKLDNELHNDPIAGSQIELSEEVSEKTSSNTKDKLARQESLKALPRQRSFNKFLSLVRLDSSASITSPFGEKVSSQDSEKISKIDEV